MNKVTFSRLGELQYDINEAYKTLRTNLSFCGDDIKVILLTSCTPNEGKSTVCIRLAQALGEDNKKVLVVDADLRKSALIGRHGVTSEKEIKGLSHYLSGQETLDNITYETNIQGVDIIFSGPVTPIPTELLGNSYFEDMITGCRDKYDYIIVDTPPLGYVIDAAVISRVCDGAIFVIEDQVISYRFAQSVMKQLELTKCKMLGAIINKVDTKTGGYYNGYSYYKGYGHRYGKYS